MEKWPLGVFTSIDAGFGVKLETAHELGLSTIQLHAPRSWLNADFSERATGLSPAVRAGQNDSLEKTDRLMELEREAVAFQTGMSALGIALTAVFGGFEGESYADIPTVVRTVGLVPLETRALRLRQMKSIADFSRRFWQCNVVALHLGFVPHDPANPQYREVVNFTRDLCDHCRANGQALHLETGQEPADVLLRFIRTVERDNLFINFDPANMIMYGVGEPIPALETLAPYVRSVHCKDAKWAAQPGQQWGREVPLGQGDVDMEAFLRTLKKIGYDGPLTIERELSQDPARQRTEVAQAISVLNSLKRKILE
jgi:sugar phosphate isomerase/epimerase